MDVPFEYYDASKQAYVELTCSFRLMRKGNIEYVSSHSFITKEGMTRVPDTVIASAIGSENLAVWLDQYYSMDFMV